MFGDINQRLPSGLFVPRNALAGQAIVADPSAPQGFGPAYTDMDYRLGFSDHDHFLYGINNTGNKTQYTNNAGTTVAMAVTGDPLSPGVVSMGTTALNALDSWWGVYVGQSTAQYMWGDGIWRCRWWFKTPTVLSNGTNSYYIHLGVASANSTTPAERVGVTYIHSSNGGAFTIDVTANSVAQTSVPCLTPLRASTKYRLTLLGDIRQGTVQIFLKPSDGGERFEGSYLGPMPTQSVPVAPQGFTFRSVSDAVTSIAVLLDAWDFSVHYATPQ
jgi:hypothetical protein